MQNNVFYVDAVTSSGQELPAVLIDTGSMISTIDFKTAKLFKLPVNKCERIEIQYGNSSKQWTDCKATLEFSTSDISNSKATMYVVDQQNESIILGMDWLELEQICLVAHLKKMYTIISVTTNLPDIDNLTQSLLAEFPGITSAEEQQPLTRASYKHRIETGHVAPVATRDYCRPPAEVAQIDIMVQDYLKKDIILNF